jgi:hypothetical protein
MLGFNQVSVSITISGFELSMMLLTICCFRLMDWKFILRTLSGRFDLLCAFLLLMGVDAWTGFTELDVDAMLMILCSS